MNNDRRREISDLIKRAEALKEQLEAVTTEASSLKDDIERVRDEEQEYFDNMPESLQGSDRGQAAEAAVSQLDEAMGTLDELADLSVDLDSAVTALDEAKI